MSNEVQHAFKKTIHAYRPKQLTRKQPRTHLKFSVLSSRTFKSSAEMFLDALQSINQRQYLDFPLSWSQFDQLISDYMDTETVFATNL
jgi:hypothetical protein